MQTKPKLQVPSAAVIAILVAVVAAGALFWPQAGTQSAPASADTSVSSNVKIEEYMQTIEIMAKGGYTPKLSIAKANLPVVINLNTNETYDCSAAVTIPAINYRARLPFTGTTTISLAPQQPDTEITGTCGMGMYSFKIRFSG